MKKLLLATICFFILVSILLFFRSRYVHIIPVVFYQIKVAYDCQLESEGEFLDFFIENYNGIRTAGVKCVDYIQRPVGEVGYTVTSIK